MADTPVDRQALDKLLDSLWAKYRSGERERSCAQFEAYARALPPETTQAELFRGWEDYLRDHPDLMLRRRRWWDSLLRRRAV